jgi:hypothetical protein
MIAIALIATVIACYAGLCAIILGGKWDRRDHPNL